MPMIQEIYDIYKDQGLQVLAINVGEPKITLNNFLKSYKSLDFPILLDPKSKVSDTYKVVQIPSTYFVSPNGKIKKHYLGALSEEQLHVFTKEILPSKNS